MQRQDRRAQVYGRTGVLPLPSRRLQCVREGCVGCEGVRMIGERR